MEKRFEFTIDADSAGTRLDRCLSRLIPGSSRSFLQKLIKEKLVTINGETVDLPRFPVKAGTALRVVMPETEEDPSPSPEPFSFPILYEDEAILVISKPAGIVVHPAAGNRDGTVVNALLGRYPWMAERFSCVTGRPGIVHRLDKDTSGCLVIAKTPEALYRLGNAFASHETGKQYLAVSRGTPERSSGSLHTLIGRHPVNRQKMAIVERNGKDAITSYQVWGTGVVADQPLALLSVTIATGRTHQIRVHLSSIRLPILGDELYGRRVAFPGVERQLLHAWKLSLPHPLTGETMTFTAPIPEDFRRVAAMIAPDREEFKAPASDAPADLADVPGNSMK